MSCGCIISLTSPPMGALFHVFLPLSRWVGSCACRGRLRFRRGRLVQALPSSPSSAGLVPFPSASVFFLPLPFQGLPVLGQVCCVGVLSFSLPLRSPLRVPVK